MRKRTIGNAIKEVADMDQAPYAVEVTYLDRSHWKKHNFTNLSSNDLYAFMRMLSEETVLHATVTNNKGEDVTGDQSWL